MISAFESPEHICPGHIMAALAHASRNPAQRELRGLESKVGDLDSVALVLPLRKVAGVTHTTQRGLKSKVRPGGGETIDLVQKQTTSGDGCEARIKGRQALGDQVSVQEVSHACDPR
jgi:hypothetical protein